MGSYSLKKKLDNLIDAAIWEGRSNWDGYYGHNNDYHRATIEEHSLYQELVGVLYSYQQKHYQQQQKERDQ